MNFTFVLSAFLSRFLHFKNGLFAKPKKSYSQFGEDIVLQKLFKKRIGFYVDVGAYHPKHYSNTYLLHKKGWRGINIDPNLDTVKLFEKQRPNDINLEIGISQEPTHLIYYTFSHSNWNTFSKEKADVWRRKPGIRFLGERKVLCAPLREILKQNLSIGFQIDLMNVDAEGMDLDVLESNDWEIYSPRVVIVESAEFNPDTPSDNKIYLFMRKKSYRLYAFMGLSLVFLKEQ